MNSFDPQKEEYSSLERRWKQDRRTHIHNIMGSGSATPTSSSSSSAPFYAATNPTSNTHYTSSFHSFPALDDHDLVAAVVPAVTVVLEGRSICHRISLHHHSSYHSLAKALRQMFVDVVCDGSTSESAGDDQDLDLSNAIPGHLIAYEDMENDLLLAGDLDWKDFVRVAKRIRILPAKGNLRKRTTIGT